MLVKVMGSKVSTLQILDLDATIYQRLYTSFITFADE